MSQDGGVGCVIWTSETLKLILVLVTLIFDLNFVTGCFSNIRRKEYVGYLYTYGIINLLPFFVDQLTYKTIIRLLPVFLTSRLTNNISRLSLFIWTGHM